MSINSEGYFSVLVGQHKESVKSAVQQEDYIFLEKVLTLMVKQASRDTRHQAAFMAQRLHGDIFNIDMDECK